MERGAASARQQQAKHNVDEQNDAFEGAKGSTDADADADADAVPLVKRPLGEDASVFPLYASSQQTPPRWIGWGLGVLGAMVLLLVYLVVRGGSLHPAVSHGGNSALSVSSWVDLLPSDVAQHVDRSVDPCEDLYAFSCGQWLEQAEIPADKSGVYLSFTTVGDRNEQVLRDVFEQNWPLVGELYASCMAFDNSSTTTDESLPLLTPILQEIAATTTKAAVLELAGRLSQTGPDFLTAIAISADSRDATHYALYASQAGLSLPDPQYFLDGDQFEAVSDAFHAFASELFTLAGWTSKQAAEDAAAVIAFEMKLAPLFVPKEELQDPVASYNRVRVRDAVDTYPLLMGHFLNGTGLLTNLTATDAHVIVETPAFFAQTEALVASDVTLSTLQAVLAYQFLRSWAPALSEPFVQTSFAFFARTLQGQQQRAPRWKVCLHAVTANFPDLVGKYYALLRFDDASEQMANELVDALQTALRETLGRVDWLDDGTRSSALSKLELMRNLIGHSKRVTHFPFELRGDAPYAENLRVIREFDFTRLTARLGGEVDRSEWFMTSAAVNAYYAPTSNQIVFPAGILQPPFFSRERHAAQNFGAIGSIMGHELTHGFDDSGRHFAGDGNLEEWWSNDTAKEFGQRTQCLVDQYADYTITSLEGGKVLGHVNGNFTLGENIADNGGVKLAFQAYQTHIATPKNGSEADEGLELSANVADKLFFVSFAQAFCAKSRDAAMVRRLATDPHSPERWRVNGVASNSREFAQIFSCPASAAMNPTDKCQLWFARRPGVSMYVLLTVF